MKASASRPLRCATYTRKSTEAGLEQEFNSLDNQREAAEAYIRSQAHEGWRLLPEAYDDGGYSGGSLERPALQRLLAEVKAGRVDVIVVYKVDRLTRSLADFAKLVELFDQHAVSFVSVTQAFNTTTSMGRLTLNVLLSFAQFEREVTAERIRDKVAATRRKGLRTGGPVPLGYAVRDKKLVVHEAEAAQVRELFARYLELGCLNALVAELRERGAVTRRTLLRDGGSRGGVPFSKGPLAYLLRNRIYVGEVQHKGRHYPGEHEALVPRELFEAVQAALTAGAQARRVERANRGSLLRGLLYDERGHRMTPSTAKKGALRYRYYVSRALEQGRRAEAGRVARVPAPELEQVVLSALGLADGEGVARCVSERVSRVVVREGAVEVQLRGDDGESCPEPLIVAWVRPPLRRRREVIRAGSGEVGGPVQSGKGRARLVEGIAKARGWLEDLVSGRVADTSAIAQAEGCSERSVRMTLNLAFLAPEVIQAAVAGTLPAGCGIAALTHAPVSWAAQRKSEILA